MSENLDVAGESKIVLWAVQPTVGRIVHYLPPNRSTPLAAVIVDVEPDMHDTFVNLTVFQPDGTTKPVKNVMQSAQLTEYCWSWPAR